MKKYHISCPRYSSLSTSYVRILRSKTIHVPGMESIIDARDLLTKGMRWIVGNGEKKIMFWTFNWVLECPLVNFIQHTQRSRLNLNKTVADYIINGNWNVNKLSSVLDQDLVYLIAEIPLPNTAQDDELIWESADLLSHISCLFPCPQIKLRHLSYYLTETKLRQLYRVLSLR